MEMILQTLLWICIWAWALYAIKQRKESENLIKENQKLQEINTKISEARDLLSEKKDKAREIINQAKEESSTIKSTAKNIVNQAKEESIKIKSDAEKIYVKAESKVESLENKEKELDKKFKIVEEKDNKLSLQEKEVEEKKKIYSEKIEKIENERIEKLEEISWTSKDEAKEILLKDVEKKTKDILLAQIKKAESDIQEGFEEKAKKAIALAVQKFAWEVASESTVTLLNIWNDDLKWKIIWREWRNINTLEKETWVDIIIDDTPWTILISWFDLLRRYIAKKSLEKLIEDWRIHPARIEEVVEKTRKEANTMLKELWEKALDEMSITWIHPDLVKIVWRLRFRTSYGQNIIKHSMEVWRICQMLWQEIWIDPEKAKIAWFFHDIWKAVDHEIEWGHAPIWYEILKKYNIPEDIAHAVWAHHEEMPIQSPLDFIVCAADMISWSRPWARRESIEKYIKRLKALEAIATSFDWVSKAFAIQAWREVRVLVEPWEVDDYRAKQIWLKIVEKIERDLAYPGQIKINVIREVRNELFAK